MNNPNDTGVDAMKVIEQLRAQLDEANFQLAVLRAQIAQGHDDTGTRVSEGGSSTA